MMRALVLNGMLLALVAVAIVGVEVWQRPAASVEASVRRYATAVANGNLDAAMAEIAPSQRDTWRGWVASQLGNVYDVTGVAVRTGWALGRPLEVTTDLDVNRAYPDQYYQASPHVALEEVDGRWYLSAPPLADTP